MQHNIRSARLAELAREDERHAEAEALARVGRQEGGEQREDREEDRRHEKVVIVLRRAVSLHSDAASQRGDGCAWARRTKKVCSRVSRTSYAMTGHGSFGQHG